MEFKKQLSTHLTTPPKEQLTQLLSELICADKTLKKQWQIKLLLAGEKLDDPAIQQKQNAKNYKKFLTKALPKKHLWGGPNLWGKVHQYFDEAEKLFDMAFESVDNDLELEAKLNWLVQSFERYNLVLEGIDDSGGYRLDLEHKLCQQVIQSFHAQTWSDRQKAKWLVDYQDHFDIYQFIPQSFELSDALMAEFNQQLNVQTKQKVQQSAQQTDNVSLELIERLAKARNEQI